MRQRDAYAGRVLVVILLVVLASPAFADDCFAQLDSRHVAYKRVARPGVALAVEITGPLGGVRYVDDEPLVIDCSLAVSLDEAGRYLHDLGIATATVASAYARRNVRGTNRPSKHSFGLAIDLPTFDGPDAGTLQVANDFESGLGDEVDCIGEPSTHAARALKILQCQLVRSGLFHLVLSPDYDDDHRDHFHLEVVPWRERARVRSPMPAIH